MGYLRLVRSAASQLAPSQPATEDTCVEAFDKELDYVFETLRRLGARPSEVEDLAHDVFVVLHRNWPTLDTTRPIRPYLFTVAFRVFSGYRRRRVREIPQASLEAEDGGASPERTLQSKEAIALLHAALEQVPLRRRAVVILHDLDEVPIIEIAQTLSISRFGAYARLRKARKELAAAVRRLDLARRRSR
jgi:RNA polymerase sigma-70 factor (ECF subfamily)